MKYVQINAFSYGSTGSIMMGLHSRLIKEGHRSYVAWARGRDPEGEGEIKFGTKGDVYAHALYTRLFDRVGFASKRATYELVSRMESIDPDVVHLHVLHGYSVNLEVLFSWLSSHRCQVKWTLHDCWPFTGHCPHFQYAECEKWKTGCFRCPQKKTYPSSYFFDSSKRNWEDKRRIFTSIPPCRMRLITPSYWLENLVRQSFLKDYPVEVEHNAVNRDVFKFTSSDFRKRYGVGDRFMILGVANPWTERKGLGEFYQLAKELDRNRFAVVLIGLDRRQIAKLKNNLVALPKTDSPIELAEAYSAADVFVHPSIEETFGMTVAEAQSCGTHVVVAEDSACAEIADPSMATIVPADMSTLAQTLIRLSEKSGCRFAGSEEVVAGRDGNLVKHARN